MKSREGFTIIELLIYLAVAGVAIVVLTNFMVDVTKAAAYSKVKKEVQTSGRLVMTNIERDIRNADAVDAIPTPDDEIYIHQGAGTSHYYLQDSKVYYDDGSGGTPISAQTVRITVLQFKNQTAGNPNEVTITLRVEQRNPSPSPHEAYAQQLTTTIVRRRAIY